jgi:hypothetical protein
MRTGTTSAAGSHRLLAGCPQVRAAQVSPGVRSPLHRHPRAERARAFRAFVLAELVEGYLMALAAHLRAALVPGDRQLLALSTRIPAVAAINTSSASCTDPLPARSGSTSRRRALGRRALNAAGRASPLGATGTGRSCTVGHRATPSGPAVRTNLRTSIPSDTSAWLAALHRMVLFAVRERMVQALREVEGLVGCTSRGGSSPLRRTGEPRELRGFRCPGWISRRLRCTD